MTDSDPDVTEKVERTDTGFRLTVESTRGTGTRDQDKVKAELRSERPPTVAVQKQMVESVKARMKTLCAHQPDEAGADRDRRRCLSEHVRRQPIREARRAEMGHALRTRRQQLDDVRETLRSTANHRDQLECAIESAISDLRIAAGGADGAIAQQVEDVAADLAHTLENPPDDLRDVADVSGGGQE